MTRSSKYITTLFLLVLLMPQCKDSYISPYPSPSTGYLVVEGFITGNGPTQFRLSRTIPLPGNAPPPAETKAQLQVEGDNSSVYPLTELGNGLYGIDTLPLDPAAKYRLRIHTAGNKDYLSDYTSFKPTPAIDSISWNITSTGVDIFANTHDISNTTRYYQWQYEETWKYTSAEYAIGIYTEPPPAVATRSPEDQIFTCWKTRASTTILLGSSDKLSQDVIYLHPINQVPGGSQQLSNMYSILVRQYALAEDAYNYLTLMQKNSESLGSIFDALPTQLKGNIHGLSNPSEQIIGFVSAGTVQQQRIFIDRARLPASWRYFFSCPLPDTLVPPDPGSLKAWFGSGNAYVPVAPHYNLLGSFDGWLGNEVNCVDCRAQGGTTKAPSYWPN